MTSSNLSCDDDCKVGVIVRELVPRRVVDPVCLYYYGLSICRQTGCAISVDSLDLALIVIEPAERWVSAVPCYIGCGSDEAVEWYFDSDLVFQLVGFVGTESLELLTSSRGRPRVLRTGSGLRIRRSGSVIS